MAAGQSGPMIASYGYIGRRASQRVYGNDTLMYYAYDGTFNQPGDFGVRQVVGTTHGRIDPATAVVLEVFDDRAYIWDEMYNKKQRKDVRAASTGQRLKHDYDYDPAYRMTHATAADTAAPGGPAVVRETTYTLDGVHNRLNTSGTVGGNPDPATGDYTMNAAACTDKAMNKYTTTPFDLRGHDHNGNLTSLKNDAVGSSLAVSCIYDYRNRMVEYRDSATDQRHTYAYDALGRRIAKTVDAEGASRETTRYFYGGESQWQVVEERDGSGNTMATYVYGRYIDEVIQMQRCPTGHTCGTSNPPVDYYYHTDDMYNVMAVTDDAGDVVERYEYGDYGSPMIMAPDGTAHTSSTIANPYLFTGRRYDPETGWYNYRTRYLDPFSGRFTGRDIIGIWGDPGELGNGYAFVRSNPLCWFDPMGLSSICEILRRQRDALDVQLKWNPKIAACNLLCALKGGRRPPRGGEPGGISPPRMCKSEDAPFYFSKCVHDCLKKYWGLKAETAGTTSSTGKISLNKNVLKKWPFVISIVIMRHEQDHKRFVGARWLHHGNGAGGGGGGQSSGVEHSFMFGFEEFLIRFNDQDFAMSLCAKIRYLEGLLGCDS